MDSYGWQTEAEQALGVKLKRHANGEACGPCPKCQEGEDRLIAFLEGNFWCRQCGYRGWWSGVPATRQQVEEAKSARNEEIAALRARMVDCRDWIKYHENVDGCGVAEWEKHGLSRSDIEYWGLGYCGQHPWVQGARSITIPIFYHNNLVDIRHRLIDYPDGNKYRSHLPGLTPSYFNVDQAVRSQTVYLVEGEKKAMVLRKYGHTPTVAYPGVSTLVHLPKLIERDFQGRGMEFIFCPDPNSMEQVEAAARTIATMGHSCYVVDLIEKPDDLLINYNGSFGYCLRYKRRIKGQGVTRR